MELSAQSRTVLGKKVKQLRRAGVTPIHLFGPGFESQPLQASTPELVHLLATTPRTAMIRLHAGNGRPSSHPTSYDVMVKQVQRDPVTGALLHVDFYRVEISHPVAVDVPLVLIGLSPAVENHLGTLVHGVNSLHIHGLPSHLPASIEVDASVLSEPHQAIHARDVTLPAGITLLSDGDLMVVNIVPPRGAEEAVTQAEEARPAEVAAKAPEGGL